MLTILAGVLVWVALVAPDQPRYLTLNGFLRVPLELLVLIALAVVLPPRVEDRGCVRRPGSSRRGRPEGHQLRDLHDLTTGRLTRLETRASSGTGSRRCAPSSVPTETKLIEVGAVVGIVVLVVLLICAMLRLTRVAAETAAGHCGRSRGSAPSGRCAGCSAHSSSPTRRSPPPFPPA